MKEVTEYYKWNRGVVSDIILEYVSTEEVLNIKIIGSVIEVNPQIHKKCFLQQSWADTESVELSVKLYCIMC